MKPERKDRMVAICKCLKHELKSELLTAKMNSVLKEHFFFLLEDRMNHYGLRSFFTYTISQYVKEQAKAEGIKLKEYSEKLFDTQLPFLAEGIITVQYYENQILDGKGGLYSDGIFNMEKVRRNVLAGHYVKDFLYRYIEERIFPDDCYNYRMTMQKVHKIFQLVDLGQAFQEKWGTYEAFKSNDKHIPITKEANDFIDNNIITSYWNAIREQGLTPGIETFTRNYLRRIYLTSSALYKLMAELVMDLLNYHGKERNNILKFAAQVGMLGQIVNDINDFVPAECNMSTISKIPSDAFADLRNDNITLPLIFYFNENAAQTICDLQKEPESPSFLLHKMQKAINAAQQATQEVAEFSEKWIRRDCVWGLLLQDMNSIVYLNKNRFYKALNKYISESAPNKTKGAFTLHSDTQKDARNNSFYWMHPGKLNLPAPLLGTTKFYMMPSIYYMDGNSLFEQLKKIFNFVVRETKKISSYCI